MYRAVQIWSRGFRGSDFGVRILLFGLFGIGWVRPPPTNRDTLGIYRGPGIITIIHCGHY